MGLSCARAGRLTAENGGFRPGQVEGLFRRLDASGDGSIDRAEFAAGLAGLGVQLPAGADEGLLSFCLPILSLYGDSLLEGQVAVTNDGAPSYAQADQREAMLDMLDKDGDGDIDYEEFVRWFKGGAGADDAADYAAQVPAA